MIFIETFYFYNGYRNKPESFIVLITDNNKTFTVFYVNLFSVIITNSWIYVHQYINNMFSAIVFYFSLIWQLSTLNLYLFTVVTLQLYHWPFYPNYFNLNKRLFS